MAGGPLTAAAAGPWRLVVPEEMYDRLHAHLFPGDGDEHGAVIAAGLAVGSDGSVRLLARELHLAVDGRDYVPGKRGYRMLKAEFVRDRVLACRDERLVYLAVHNHGGDDRVGFSSDDFRSHERGYPALLDVARGMPIGALVFAPRAVAGDVWLPDGRRVELAGASIVGRRLRRLAAAPAPASPRHDPTYDRQARLFGDVGQDILRRSKVGIIGLGGVGSLLAEYLGRLGVGRFVLIDPDSIEPSNLPRVVGARRQLDALAFLADPVRPAWLRALARRFARPKVAIARRVIRQANPAAQVEAVVGDVLDPRHAGRLLDCDYLFLAADTMRARLLFNAIVHQYLLPGVQVGAKVRADRATGSVIDVHSIARPVTPDRGCLWCNGLISPAKLQEEGQGEQERQAQRYVEEAEIVAPSVITLNAAAAARAADDFLFYMTGLTQAGAEQGYIRFAPLRRQVWIDDPRKGADCPECGNASKGRLGRGDARRLPTRIRS